MRRELEEAVEEGKRQQEAAKAANEELASAKRTVSQQLEAAQARSRELEDELERATEKARKLEESEQLLDQEVTGLAASLGASQSAERVHRADSEVIAGRAEELERGSGGRGRRRRRR